MDWVDETQSDRYTDGSTETSTLFDVKDILLASVAVDVFSENEEGLWPFLLNEVFERLNAIVSRTTIEGNNIVF